MNTEHETYVKLKYFPLGVCELPEKVLDMVIDDVFDVDEDNDPIRRRNRWAILCDPPEDCTPNTEIGKIVIKCLIEYYEQNRKEK
jgi:hypothetical protein